MSMVKRVSTFTTVGVILGVTLFIVVIFSLQLFLTLRQRYPDAVSNEITERSRIFTEEVRETLEKRQ